MKRAMVENFRPAGEHVNDEGSAVPEDDVSLAELEIKPSDELGETKRLATRIAVLERQNERLATLLQDKTSYKWGVCYRVDDKTNGASTTYLGKPSWTQDEAGIVSLKGTSHIRNITTYGQSKGNIAFFVVKIYSATGDSNNPNEAKNLPDTVTISQPPRPIGEEIIFVAEAMEKAFFVFTKSLPHFKDYLPGDFQTCAKISAPYVFWFYSRTTPVINSLPAGPKSLMKLLASYLDQEYSQQYQAFEDMFGRGMVSRRAMDFLIQPGDILISLNQKETPQAYVASTRLAPKISADAARSKAEAPPPNVHALGSEGDSYHWFCSAWYYGYNGGFYRKEREVELTVHDDCRDPGAEFSMNALQFVPLRFANERLRAKLERRGRMFWTFRERRVVSYEGVLIGHSSGVCLTTLLSKSGGS
jgi:hypothetical protein